MLMVTHGCNLNCTYCYEKFKNGAKQMDITLAKEIILKEIDIVKKDERFKELEVDFMGGEPLLSFDLIKEVVEWMECHCDIPFVCFASTNGTLLTNEMKEWFRHHRLTAYLGASYDGVGGKAQEINRGTTSLGIDLEFFNDVWPAQGFKLTISKESLPYLYESLVDASRKGYLIDASLAHGANWNLNDAFMYRQQLQKISEFYLSNPQYEPSNLLLRDLSAIGEKAEYQAKFCGSGTYMATYDVDGTMYGCHMFTPVVLGKKALPHSEFKGWTNERELTDPSCKGCTLLNWCSTCLGFNILDRGWVNLRDHRWCAMNAAQAISACEFQLEYFYRLTQLCDLKEREAWILQGAVSAAEHLSALDICKSFPQ